MKHKPVWVVLAIVIAFVLVAALMIRSRFEADLALASARAAQGSVIVATRCAVSYTHLTLPTSDLV